MSKKAIVNQLINMFKKLDGQAEIYYKNKLYIVETSLNFNSDNDDINYVSNVRESDNIDYVPREYLDTIWVNFEFSTLCDYLTNYYEYSKLDKIFEKKNYYYELCNSWSLVVWEK